MALSCVGAGDLSVVALAEAERVASRAHYFTVLDARGSPPFGGSRRSTLRRMTTSIAKVMVPRRMCTNLSTPALSAAHEFASSTAGLKRLAERLDATQS